MHAIGAADDVGPEREGVEGGRRDWPGGRRTSRGTPEASRRTPRWRAPWRWRATRDARRAWLSREGWGDALEGLPTRRIPNADDLSASLPAGSVFWPGSAASEPEFAPDGRAAYPGGPGSEAAGRARGAALGEAMVRTMTLHAALLRALSTPPPPGGEDGRAGRVAEEDLPRIPRARVRGGASSRRGDGGGDGSVRGGG